MLALDDLTTPLTRDEVEASIYQVLAAVGLSTTTWKPGAWARTAITGASICLSAFSTLNAKLARMRFLDLAEDEWLTLKAKHDYDEDRDEGSAAAGVVTLVNSEGGIYNLDPGDLILLNTATGKTYRNTSSIALGALSTLTDVGIEAEEAGSASSAAAGAIDDFVTPLNGVTVTNPTALVGTDPQEDPELRTACSEKLGSLSPFGPWDAYNYAAKNATRASNGSLVGVTRVRSKPDGFGNITTYVATASGGVSGDADDEDTDLGAVNEAIQRGAAPLAITVNVESATPLAIAVTYQVWIYSSTGLTDQQVKDAIAARLAEYLATEPIGGNVLGSDPGKVFKDALIAAIGSTKQPTDAFSTLPIFRVVISTPASDVELDESEVPVLGTVTATVTQVQPPEGF
jgi:uncharacterized phage protein gp47/JayE